MQRQQATNFLLLYYIYVAVRRILHITLIRINKWIVQSDRLFLSKQPGFHKILLVGDGFAEGLGDYVTIGTHSGVSHHMIKNIHEDKFVRQRWAILNRGRAGAVTSDWIPTELDDQGSDGSKPKGKSFFNKVVESEACRNAAIVVILMGTMDVVFQKIGMPLQAYKKSGELAPVYTEDEFCQTLRNIRSTAEAFRKMGKTVVVCDVITNGAGLDSHLGDIKRVNRQIRQYAKSTQDEENPVKLVRLSNPVVERSLNRAFDGLHLNSKGYKALSKLIFEEVRADLIAEEVKVWKPML
ncbi:unnamed protein product, partial [Heterosigma akashiwo]